MDTFDIDAAAAELVGHAKELTEEGGIGFENAFVPLFAAACKAAKDLDRADYLAGAMVRNLPTIIEWANGCVALFSTHEEELDCGEET